MSRARILAAVVVALALVFFVGIGAGAARRDGEQSSSPQSEGSPLDRIRRKIASDSLVAPCLDRARRELAVTGGQACTVTVPGSWYPVRRLTLRLKAGTAAALTIKQPGSLTEKRGLTAGKTTGVDLFGGQATVGVSCPAACTVGVE